METVVLRDKILISLYSLGEVPKKTLHAAFVSYDNSFYSNTIRKLVDDGLVKQRKRDAKIHVSLTTKGVARVKELDPSRGEFKYVRDSDFMRRRRDDMFATAKATMIACGIIVSGTMMPDLKILLSKEVSSEERIQELIKFEKAVKKGVFFSSADIREACLLTGEQAEYVTGARMLGVLIIRNSIYYVYNVKKFIISFYHKREKKTILATERVLAKLDGTEIQGVAKSAAANPEKVRSSIILATEKSMLVKLYRGDKFGKDDMNALPKYKVTTKNNWKRVHATFESLGVSFNPIYFVTCDKEGARLLKRIQNTAMGLKNPNIDILDRLNLKRDNDTTYESYDPSNNRDVVPLGWLDFKEIDTYIKEGISRSRQYTVVGPKYFKDPISRCFGETIKEFIDSSTMEPVKILRYDNRGKRVGIHPIDSAFEALDASSSKKEKEEQK